MAIYGALIVSENGEEDANSVNTKKNISSASSTEEARISSLFDVFQGEWRVYAVFRIRMHSPRFHRGSTETVVNLQMRSSRRTLRHVYGASHGKL